MSVRESRQGVVTLGSCRVRVDYPGRLGDWFDGLVDRKRAGGLTSKWVRLRDDAPQEGFRVTSSSGRDVAARGLGDALATFWEHVTFLLVDQLGDALRCTPPRCAVTTRSCCCPARAALGKHSSRCGTGRKALRLGPTRWPCSRSGARIRKSCGPMCWPGPSSSRRRPVLRQGCRRMACGRGTALSVTCSGSSTSQHDPLSVLAPG